jgi:hypothetical protein
MMLFVPDTGGTLSLDASQSDVDLTLATVTPTKINTLWVWLAGRNDDAGDFSAYAMTTDDPGTWTERYEQDAVGQCTIAGASSAIRSQTSATGNLTATGSGGIQAGIVFAIGQVLNANPAATAQALTSAQLASTIETSSNVPVSAIAITATQPASTTSADSRALWSTPDKNTEAAINQAKNTETVVNTAKNAETFTNLDKTL